VHELVAACPAILSEKPLELQRKVDFLCSTLNMEIGDCLAHPTYLGASLMQVGVAVCLAVELYPQMLLFDGPVLVGMGDQASTWSWGTAWHTRHTWGRRSCRWALQLIFVVSLYRWRLVGMGDQTQHGAGGMPGAPNGS
jgi:hypothetical protein